MAATGTFPIHAAAKLGDMALVEKLLQKRRMRTGSFDLNEGTRAGVTLYIAAAAGGCVCRRHACMHGLLCVVRCR